MDFGYPVKDVKRVAKRARGKTVHYLLLQYSRFHSKELEPNASRMPKNSFIFRCLDGTKWNPMKQYLTITITVSIKLGVIRQSN